MSKTYGIPANNVSLIAHEIAHQWFGDSVTECNLGRSVVERRLRHLLRGPVYSALRRRRSFSEVHEERGDEVSLRTRKRTRTPIFDRDTEDLLKLLNANNYQKGAWVLHMLRSNLGDEVFFRGIRNYYEAHKNSTATTEDLRAALEKASGKDLQQLFRALGL